MKLALFVSLGLLVHNKGVIEVCLVSLRLERRLPRSCAKSLPLKLAEIRQATLVDLQLRTLLVEFVCVEGPAELIHEKMKAILAGADVELGVGLAATGE